jgi:hypothetical protein
MPHLKRGPGGHLLRGAGGHLVHTCAPAADCTACADTSSPDPASIDVTWSTTSNFGTGCIDGGTDSADIAAYPTSGTANLLLSPADDCIFKKWDTTVSVAYSYYASANDCTGTPDDSGTLHLLTRVRIVVISGRVHYVVKVQLCKTEPTGNNAPSGFFLSLFETSSAGGQESDSPYDCTANATLPNGWVFTGLLGPEGGIACAGGTVTVEPVAA